MRRCIISVLLLLLLAGAVGAEPRVIDMEFKNAPVMDVFHILGEIAGHNVLVDPSVKGTVSFYLKDLAISEALDLVAKSTGYGYLLLGNTLVVATPARLREDFATKESAFLQVQNVTVADVQQLIGVVVPGVRVFSDPRLDLIVLHGSPADLELAKGLIRQYDLQGAGLAGIALSAGEELDLAHRSMVIEHADGAVLVRSLQQQYPGRQFSWISEVRTLIGRATPEEWAEIAAWVRSRDLPTFYLRGIVTQHGTSVLLIEYEGVTHRLRPGDSIQGWVLDQVEGRTAHLSKDGLVLRLQIGR